MLRNLHIRILQLPLSRLVICKLRKCATMSDLAAGKKAAAIKAVNDYVKVCAQCGMIAERLSARH